MPTSSAVTQAPKPLRRRQAERSEEMRTRILDATLHCLAHYGYAGTGVAQVVEHAGVSRGAWSHHFASMNVLIVEAAKHLMLRVYQQLSDVLIGVALSQGDARALVMSVWQDFFASEVNEIYLELLIAARHEPELTEQLRELSGTLERNLDLVTAQRLDPLPDAVVKPLELLMLSRWVLRGLALDAPLMTQDAVDRALDAWVRVVSSQIQRKG